MQSTALVYRGDSGGMLLDVDGNVLGIVTSNARSLDGSIIPNINFSVPKNVFSSLVNPAVAKEHMKLLDTEDADLDALWNLEDVEFSFKTIDIKQIPSRL